MYSMNENTIGHRIRSLRTTKGISMSALADQIGTKSSTISDWENGRNLPGAKLIIELSDFFKVSTDWLLRGDAVISMKEFFPVSFSQLAFLINQCVKENYYVEFSQIQAKSFEVTTKIFGAIERTESIHLLLSKATIEELKNEKMPYEFKLTHPDDIVIYRSISLTRSPRGLSGTVSNKPYESICISTGIQDDLDAYMIVLYCPPNWFTDMYNHALESIYDNEIISSLKITE